MNVKDYKTIFIEAKNNVISVWLNRPEVHNAMNALMIEELTDAYSSFDDDQIRAIVLRGKGKSFCAGADLNYMKEIASFGLKENKEDSLKLARLFQSIYICPFPNIAVVHGAAFGGANGLLAACDIVLAEENTTFAFSEVKLGIAPATIAPFVIKRIGEYGARELMITGKRFKTDEALKWRLVNHSSTESELEDTLNKLLTEIKRNGPKAVRAAKKLIHSITDHKTDGMLEYTAQIIAELRASDEGQEGMASFLEKRKPNW
ncbi:MAG: enoyl-CoA hydratase/isomerase family protein [Bacteroidetes bacterium]|nr:enoyl-CoA hydratase/isomerase family protein [Bacteroidota bacterium]